MTNEEFLIEVENSHNRSKRILIKKAAEYTSNDKDRFEQFYRAGWAQMITAPSVLVGMAAKHFISIADMAKEPDEYSLKKWDEKVTDLRNYTYLLNALVRDIREENKDGKIF